MTNRMHTCRREALVWRFINIPAAEAHVLMSIATTSVRQLSGSRTPDRVFTGLVFGFVIASVIANEDEVSEQPAPEAKSTLRAPIR